MSKTETLIPCSAKSLPKIPPTSPQPMIAMRRIACCLGMLPSPNSRDYGRGLSIPDAGGNQHLAAEEGASSPNQTRSHHVHFAASAAHFNFYRKLPAGMLDRKPPHRVVVCRNNPVRNRTRQQTGRAYRHCHQDPNRGMTLVWNESARGNMTTVPWRRNQRDLGHHLRPDIT